MGRHRINIKNKKKSKAKKLESENRDDIREKLDAFCSLDPERETFGNIKYQRDRIVTFLKHHNIGKNSSLYRQLNESFLRYREYFRQQLPIQPLVSQNETLAPTKRKYIGILTTESGDYTIKNQNIWKPFHPHKNLLLWCKVYSKS